MAVAYLHIPGVCPSLVNTKSSGILMVGKAIILSIYRTSTSLSPKGIPNIATIRFHTSRSTFFLCPLGGGGEDGKEERDRKTMRKGRHGKARETIEGQSGKSCFNINIRSPILSVQYTF
jgi:hypothetical protein